MWSSEESEIFNKNLAEIQLIARTYGVTPWDVLYRKDLLETTENEVVKNWFEGRKNKGLKLVSLMGRRKAA